MKQKQGKDMNVGGDLGGSQWWERTKEDRGMNMTRMRYTCMIFMKNKSMKIMFVVDIKM